MKNDNNKKNIVFSEVKIHSKNFGTIIKKNTLQNSDFERKIDQNKILESLLMSKNEDKEIITCCQKNNYAKFSKKDLREIFFKLDKSKSGLINSSNLNLRNISAKNLDVFSDVIIEIYKHSTDFYNFDNFFYLCKNFL